MARRYGHEEIVRVFSGRSVSTLGGEAKDEERLTFFVMLNLVQHPACPMRGFPIRRDGP